MKFILQMVIGLTLISTLNTVSAEAASTKVRIHGWEETLPVSQQTLLAFLRAEAAYLSFETDEETCGGQVFNPELIEVHPEPTNGNQTAYNIKVRFTATKAVNYCASEVAMTCETPFLVSTESDVIMGTWACE